MILVECRLPRGKVLVNGVQFLPQRAGFFQQLPARSRFSELGVSRLAYALIQVGDFANADTRSSSSL